MKRSSPREYEKMHETAPVAARWRRRLRWLLARGWLQPTLAPVGGIHGRRMSPARMEVEPAAPARSWADWEISRSGRPGA